MPTHIQHILQLIITSLVSFSAVNWVYFKILKVAKMKNLVDNPDARKLQKEPIPVMGGIAVFFGVMCAILTAITMKDNMIHLLPVIVAMTTILYIGALDDICGLTPKTRLVLESLMVLGMIYGTEGCANSFHGLFGIEEFGWEYGVPLTVFVGVGIINAINMVDGVNGLSSGLCIVCCSIFGITFAACSNWVNATLAFAMAAALIPFFLHNVFGKTSRMFIGDAGTMVLGTAMTWFVINMLRPDFYVEHALNHRVGIIPLVYAILSIPVADTIRVMTARIVKGNSPFKADKSHLHHKFIYAGFSHSITALCEIIMNLMVVFVWYLCFKLGCGITIQFLFTVAFSVILIWGTYVYLRWHEKFDTKTLEKIRNLSRKTHFGHSQWWIKIQEFLDAPESKNEETERHQARIQSKFDNSRLEGHKQ